MSGFEVAGLALAVLPVLMAAAQQYNDSLGPLSRYKRFAREARSYSRELEVQRTIFRNECRNLLEEVVDHDTASGMLNALDQQAWEDKKLDKQLAQLLGDSLEACITIIRLIEERLLDISGETEGFKSIVEHEKKTTHKTIRDKLWKHNVREKLRLSFSKSRLDENIAKLRSHNDDLRVLASQTRHTVHTSIHAKSKSPSRARADIRRYQTIGKASCQVYEALRTACKKHAEHMVHFRMKVEHVTIDRESAPQVKFDMAFTHRILADTLNSGDPIWFLVDSIINEHLSTCANDPTACMVELQGSLRRQLEAETTTITASKRVKKTVKFAPPEPSPAPSPYLPRLVTKPIVLANSKGIDFCDLLRRHFCRPLQTDTCVVLEDSAECKQIVYPSHFTASSELRKATSLGQLLRSTITPDLTGGILLHERVALAKMLAVAVLQYHATPWLQLSWLSEDILFFTIERDTQTKSRPNLAIPYINTRIQGQRNLPSTQHQSRMARNPMLFSLGVVLLELAHATSLESLKLPCDADSGPLHGDFFTARRLAKSKRNAMGAIYNNIVEQLVECVFPCSGDLTNPELQAVFYKDVICPLDELEQGFRKLGLGAVGS